MPRFLSAIPTLILAASIADPALASRVVVPTDVPTIQAAIDGTADTIGVLDSVAPERLTVARCVVIEPVVGSRPNFLNSWTTTPLVQSLEIIPNGSGSCFSVPGISIRGVRFLGRVDASALNKLSDRLNFEACRFDSGFAGPGGGTSTTFVVLRVQGCLFLGDAELSGFVQFVGNTIIGGMLRVRADGVHDVRNNYVQGPAEAGMELRLSESVGMVEANTVRGTGDGIRLIGNSQMAASWNNIADCTGDGIEYNSIQGGGILCASNTITRCGGTGIVVRLNDPMGTTTNGAIGNVIRDVDLDGIDFGNGIATVVRGNVILDAGGNGFTAGVADSCEDNVIGRCGGAGMRLTHEPRRIVGNTIVSNVGPGLHFNGAYAGDLVAKNISVFNGGPGLLFEGTHFPQSSCNDWFGNAGGQTLGIAPSYSDISVNPRFCDLGANDLHLSASSPLLADPNCGLIGALGQGCAGTTDVPEAAISPSAAFRVSPTPARGAVSFALPVSTGQAEIEVFDVTGARRWRSGVPAGRTRLEWNRKDLGGNPVGPGVYFARLRREGANAEQVRLVLAK